MVSRCYNKNDKAYRYYGGRGITVVKKWRTFTGFWDDMKDSYFENASIERISVNGNYRKQNCKWILQTEQPKNKTNTLFVKYHGREVRLRELCANNNVEYMLVYQRIKLYGWQIERAISVPSRLNK
jgi:hypothetical protein